jgi:hypothetical protein
VNVAVGTGVAVGVAEGPGTEVEVPGTVAVDVAVSVEEAVRLGTRVLVAVGPGVMVTGGSGVGDAVAVGVELGIRVGDGWDGAAVRLGPGDDVDPCVSCIPLWLSGAEVGPSPEAGVPLGSPGMTGP